MATKYGIFLDHMSGNFAILQAKIGLNKAEPGKVENNSNFGAQNWLKL